MTYGRYFDELDVGKHFRHWPGRTITEFDDTLFSLMSMNQHPVHIDEHYASATQHGRRLVEGPLVISLLIGMSQADIGGGAPQKPRHFRRPPPRPLFPPRAHLPAPNPPNPQQPRHD